MLRCLWYGFGFTFLMYFAIAYAGYFTFPSSVAQNLVSSDYGKDKLVIVAEVFLALYVLAIIPLFAHAFRKSVAELLLKRIRGNAAKNPIGSASQGGVASASASQQADGDNNNNGNNTTDFQSQLQSKPVVVIDTLNPELRNIVENPQLAYVPRLTPKTEQQFSFAPAVNTMMHGVSTRGAAGAAVVQNKSDYLHNHMHHVGKKGKGKRGKKKRKNKLLLGGSGGGGGDNNDNNNNNENNSDSDSDGGDSFSSHSCWDSDERAQKAKLRNRLKSIASDAFQLPLGWHVFVTLSFLGSALLIAIFADNIGTVNSLISSTTLPITCYVMPAMVAYKTKTASKRMKVITIATAVMTMVNGVLQVGRQVAEWFL